LIKRGGIAKVVWIGLILLGPFLLGLYFCPWILGDQAEAIASDNGLSVYASGDVNVTNVAIAVNLNTTTPLLGLTIWCSCKSHIFNILTTLPFHVTAGFARWPWNVTPTPTPWSFTYVGRAASIVYSQIVVDQDNALFQAIFPVDPLYLSSDRGSRTVVIQLARPVGGTKEYQQLINRLGVRWESLPTIDVYVDLPGSSTNIQAFPETSTRDLLPTSLAGNNSIDSISWHLTDRQTITVSYLDETKAGYYEMYLAVGSLIAGADISIAIEYLKPRRTNFLDK
jgi:hypothetical protein